MPPIVRDSGGQALAAELAGGLATEMDAVREAIEELRDTATS